VIGVDVSSSYSSDPLERVFRALRAEYGDKVDGDVLTRTLREAHQHADWLGLLNKPRLVDQAVRDLLDDYLEPQQRRTPG
jgi:hypothetical protein